MTISKFVFSAGLCSALVLGACTDPGTLTVQDDPNQNAKQGALLGGLLGAGVGAIANDSNPALGALAGAAIGAAAGALSETSWTGRPPSCVSNWPMTGSPSSMPVIV